MSFNLVSHIVRNLFPSLVSPKNFAKNLPQAITLTTIPELEKQAVVTQLITPYCRGQVYFRGSWWLAVCPLEVTLYPEQVVYVISRQNLTLLVEPIVCHLP